MNTEVKPAGFWIRTRALCVDTFICMVPLVILEFYYYSPYDSNATIINVSGLILCVLYYVMFTTSSWQATPGKRWLGIYVGMKDDYRPLGKSRSLLRYVIFAGPALFFSLPGSIPTTSDHLQGYEREQYTDITDRLAKGQEVTADEQIFIDDAEIALVFPHMNADQRRQYFLLADKQNQGEELTREEGELLVQLMGLKQKEGTNPVSANSLIAPFMPLFIWLIAYTFYTLLQIISIVVTREKTGIHDMVAGTRVIYGRPAGSEKLRFG